jgi:NTP pyrophosphatase (non-canonical NTP hydrolase)
MVKQNELSRPVWYLKDLPADGEDDFNHIMMTVNDYQVEGAITAIYPEGKNGLYYCALKLAGEAGEVAEHIGKAIRDDNSEITPERREALALELGDVLWYVAALCNELDLNMSKVAEDNLRKLADRKARGVLGGSGDYR